MKLFTVISALVISRRPFSFIKGSRSCYTIDDSICNQCEVHLRDEYSDKANGPQFIWPALYWIILHCKDIHNNYSSGFIWKIVPLEWHEWRFDKIVLQFPEYYNIISITETQSILMDRNKDLETWKKGIKYQKLSSIDDACDQFLLPTVLCPWGWLEFIHKVGYVDLDTVIQQFIQKCNFLIVNVSKLSKIEHTRDDYLQESNNDYDMWIHNTDWELSPKKSFVDGYPRVLTCKYHDSGYNLIQIHCCRWRTNVPSPVSSQVYHAVVKPRTVKHMKVV